MLPTSSSSTSNQSTPTQESSILGRIGNGVARVGNGVAFAARHAVAAVGAYGTWGVVVVHNATILTAAASAIGMNPALLPFIAPYVVPPMGTAAFVAGYLGTERLVSVSVDGIKYVARVVYQVAVDRFSGETRPVAIIQEIQMEEGQPLLEGNP